MHIQEVKKRLKELGWSVSGLARRWEFSRRYVTEKLASSDRGELWNDAIRGLPPGTGRYTARGQEAVLVPCRQYGPDEVRRILRERRWSISALADHWGFGRRHVTAQLSAEVCSALWSDALRGIAEGPGLYRSKTDAPSEMAMGVGSLVASEADMYSFDYGARGVVVDVPRKGVYHVVWDGGSEMEIDQECLDDWVVELGFKVKETGLLVALALPQRIEAAKQLDLNSC